VSKAFKLPDNIDTDVIIAARYLDTTDPQELAKHCLEDALPGFSGQVEAGDVLVAGSNFGSGSSREHAPVAIKAAGISCVIAKSFARIFFRNSFNMGLPLMECAEAAEKIQAGDQVEVDFQSGTIRNLTRQQDYQARPLPDFIRELTRAGGLVNYAKARLSCTKSE